jgi:hypothetical protein
MDFIESTALFMAMEGEDGLEEYLAEQFLKGELVSLARACDRLSLAAEKVAAEK